MNQDRNEERNGKLFTFEQKWIHNITKLIGINKDIYKRQIHNNKCLHKKYFAISHTSSVTSYLKLQNKKKISNPKK